MLDERDFAGFNSLYDWCSLAYVTGQKSCFHRKISYDFFI